MQVKSKSSIKLPGFDASNSMMTIEETPVSQITQNTMTPAPEPHLPGMPSPHKIMHGSILNKPVSPRPSKSPAKTATGSPLINSAKKKKLDLDGFNDGVWQGSF